MEWKLRPRGNLAVDVRRHFRLEAGRVKALVSLHVREQAGIEPATARTGDTDTSFRFEGGEGFLSQSVCRLGAVRVDPVTGVSRRASTHRNASFAERWNPAEDAADLSMGSRVLDHIPTGKEVLKKWLKAGFMENRTLFPTKAGTPQGGIISPTLANLTLDRLERLLKHTFRYGRSMGRCITRR